MEIKDAIKSFGLFIVGVAILSVIVEIVLASIKISTLSSNMNIFQFFILLQTITSAILGLIVALKIVESNELFWRIFLTAILTAVLTAIGLIISWEIYTVFFSKIF